MRERELTTRLSDWTAEGLITEQARERIATYERERAPSRRGPWAIYGVLILGACILSVGVISLVAANWRDIPAAAKLGLAFALLGGLGAALFRAYDAPRRLRFDVLATLYALFSLATLGLIAQIYHSGGRPYQALLLWLVLIAPMTYIATHGFVPQLWVASSIGLFVVWALDETALWMRLFGERGDDLWTLFLIVPSLCLLLGNLASRRPRLAAASRGYDFWAFAGALVAIVATDVYFTFDEMHLATRPLAPAIVIALAAAGSLWARADLPQRGRLLLCALIGLSLLAYLPGAWAEHASSYRHSNGHELQGAAYLVVALLLLAAYFAVREQRRLFNAMTILVGLRFLIVYFQVIGDLATTGLGLMASGLVLIGTALAWYKTRDRLAAFVAEVVK